MPQKTFINTLKKKIKILSSTEIILTSPSDWEIWNEVFKYKAKVNNLWAYIDPNTDGEKLIGKPVMPEESDFMKY